MPQILSGILTLHDCWSFLGSYYPTHIPAPNKELVDELHAFWGHPQPNLCATTPSKWLQKEALNFIGLVLKLKLSTILFQSFFENKNTHACKEAFGLKLNIPTVLVVAGNLNEKRKGGEILNLFWNQVLPIKCNFF